MGIPKIGITLGDPGGIGPEVAFKSLLQCEELESICPIIFGPSSLLAHGKLTPIVRQLNVIQLTDLASLDGSPNRDAAVYFLETEDLPPLGPEGKDDGANGHIAYQSIVHAAALAGEGSLDGLVTAPISKTSFKLGGIKDSGHTSLLQRLTGAHDVSMAFFTPALKVVLATIHIPLAEVPAALDEETLCRAIRNGRDFVRALGITNPRIAVAGLNPHAGEGGLFGHEESTVLAPILENLDLDDAIVSGPFPPDTVFYRALQGEFDIVIALYHDQGLIPVKLNGFDHAVNVTLGLPFVRTSPDHGTAFDIAYQDRSSPNSMLAAISLAKRLIERRNK